MEGDFIKIGDKEYKADDIKKLEESASKAKVLEEGISKFKPVEEFASKYNLDPETLIANADGAFTLVSKLIEDGVIDQTGKVLIKKGEGKAQEKEPSEGKDDSELAALLLQGKGGGEKLEGKDKMESVIASAVQSALSPYAKALQELTEVQTGMLRDRWEARIKEKFPNLDSEKISKVFQIAANDRKHGLLEIAEAVSKDVAEKEAALKLKFAQEWGVDLKEVDENKLFESGPGGGAAVMAQGKKFTLSKRRGENKEFVDPRQATVEYMKKKGMLR